MRLLGVHPVKTLLRPGEVSGEAERVAGGSRPELRWGEIAEYRDFMIRGLDDSKEIKGYEQLGVTVIKGAGKLAGPGQVDVDGRILRSERIVSDRERAADPGDRGARADRLLDQPRGDHVRRCA